MADKQLAIILTSRPPISIKEKDWPILAEASDKEYDNEHECQANRISKWWVKVRQHQDGRTIVYAGYTHNSNWQLERDFSLRGGVFVDHAATAAEIVQTLCDVCGDMSHIEHAGGDAARWDALMRSCVADMPAEEIA